MLKGDWCALCGKIWAYHFLLAMELAGNLW